MKTNLFRGFVAAVAMFAALPLLFRSVDASQTTSAPAGSTAKGDQWETTSQMSMENMPMKMPATTLKVCSAKGRTEPPGAANGQRNCKNSNFRQEGTKVTWDVACTGPTMTGTAEIIYVNPNSYTGTIKFVTEQGNMTINLSGKKLGECDNPQ
jgi:hypothetical protein